MNPNNFRSAHPRRQNKDEGKRSEIQSLQRRQNQIKNFDAVVRDVLARAPARGAFGRPSYLDKKKATGPRKDLTFAGKDGGDALSSAAAAYSRGYSSQKAQFNVIEDGIVIRKRELLGSLAGTVAFTVANTFNLNPGLVASFPWLSTQAVGWEQYKFRKLKYIYYTRTGTATPGSVMLVPDYDAADAAPTSEIQAMDYKDAKEEAPWVIEFCCDLNPKAMHPGGARKFIRQGTVAGTDIKTYDSGIQYVLTQDGTATPWGKLFVEYEVELAVSQLPSSSSLSALSSGVSTAGTSANCLATMVYTNGTLGLSGTANTLTVTGLSIGTEYLLTFGTSANSTCTYSSSTGFTAKTSFNYGAGGYPVMETLTATAVSGTIVLAATATGAYIVSLVPLPTYAV